MIKKVIKSLAVLWLTAFILGGCGGEAEENRDGQKESGQSGSEETGQKESGQSGSEETGQKESGQRGNKETRPGPGNAENGESAAAGNAGEEQSGNAGEEQSGNAGEEQSGNVGEEQSGSGEKETDRTAAGEGAAEVLREADPDSEAAREKYRSALEDVYFNRVFPDGQDYGYQPAGKEDISSNSFAVYDIDFDGKSELILTYTTTYMGGMVEMIYGYDSASDSLLQEFLAFPSLTYYNNGIVEEQASHNHGMASDGGSDGNFWPYTLYQYHQETDSYDRIASVDGWSKAYREEDYDGNPFPDGADADGDGMVYRITMGAEDGQATVMDWAEYDAWRKELLRDTVVMEISRQKLTTENIAGLSKR